jgi:hypothetical protein
VVAEFVVGALAGWTGIFCTETVKSIRQVELPFAGEVSTIGPDIEVNVT